MPAAVGSTMARTYDGTKKRGRPAKVDPESAPRANQSSAEQSGAMLGFEAELWKAADTPDISILSDQFLADVRGLQHKNLAVELLRKLLNDEVKTRSKYNLVQARSFADLLERAVGRYQNRAIEAAQFIEELIGLAQEMREAQKRGEKLGLSSDEPAFYDALEVNDSSVQVLGDDTLRLIARELVETMRRNVTIDWTVKESVRAQLRVIVRCIIRRYGNPPGKQDAATSTVLQQAELLSDLGTERGAK